MHLCYSNIDTENNISNWSSNFFRNFSGIFYNGKLKILCIFFCKGFSISHYKKSPKSRGNLFRWQFERLFSIFSDDYFLGLVWGTNIWNINFGDQRIIISYSFQFFGEKCHNNDMISLVLVSAFSKFTHNSTR